MSRCRLAAEVIVFLSHATKTITAMKEHTGIHTEAKFPAKLSPKFTSRSKCENCDCRRISGLRQCAYPLRRIFGWCSEYDVFH